MATTGTSARLWAVTHVEAIKDPVNYTVPPALVTDGDWLVIGSDDHPAMVNHGDYLAAQTVAPALFRNLTLMTGGTFAHPHTEQWHVSLFEAHFNSGAQGGMPSVNYTVRGSVPSVNMIIGNHPVPDFYTAPPPVASTSFADAIGWVNAIWKHPTGPTTSVAPNTDMTAWVGYFWRTGQTAAPSNVTFHVDAQYAEAGTPTLWERQAGKWVQLSDDWSAPHGAMHALDPPAPIPHHARMWTDSPPPGHWVSIGESAIFDGVHWIRP